MMSRKIRTGIVIAAAAAALTTGGLAAYFTDGDTATNTFTVGKVSIDLQEPDWDPDTSTDLTPEQEIPKNPKIENDGINDAFVFMQVSVPYASVVTANEDGTKNAAADTELFTYTVNPGWVELGTAQKDASTGLVTHLYAYGTSTAMTPLAAEAATPTLFDRVKFVNIVEDQDLEGSQLSMAINSYAIQTVNINDGKTTSQDGSNTDGATSPSAVWSALSSQMPSTDVDGAEDAKTDIKA